MRRDCFKRKVPRNPANRIRFTATVVRFDRWSGKKLDNYLCGCGLPVAYCTNNGDLACNKYLRCRGDLTSIQKKLLIAFYALEAKDERVTVEDLLHFLQPYVKTSSRIDPPLTPQRAAFELGELKRTVGRVLLDRLSTGMQ